MALALTKELKFRYSFIGNFARGGDGDANQCDGEWATVFQRC